MKSVHKVQDADLDTVDSGKQDAGFNARTLLQYYSNIVYKHSLLYECPTANSDFFCYVHVSM